jgi:CRISPR-associated protein Cas1
MQIYLDSYGAQLGVKNGMFFIEPKNTEAKSFAVHKVSTIFLTKGTSVSTDAILLALENDVKIIFLDTIGRSIGQVWNGKLGSISTIRKNQAIFTQSIKGVDWIRQIVIQKIESQQDLLSYFLGIFPQYQVLFNKTFETQSKIITNIQEMNIKNTWANQSWGASMRGWEGTCSREYFKCLSTILPIYYQFEERSRKPAKDIFNCLLNYTYGMLYSMVELALIRAGVDPFMGVLHADEYNKPTMVFDFIEPFRKWADETVMNLLLKELVQKDFFEAKDNGLWLSKKGKPIVIESFNTFIEDTIVWNGKPRKRITHLDLKAQQFAQELLNFKENDVVGL